jgi:acyl-CoA synthetase (AMP-forming)/AMP-acid ligase II
VAEAVRHWAWETPDREALACGAQRWTWRELQGRVARSAGGLLAAGLRRGDCFAFVDRNHPACCELMAAAAWSGTAAAIVNWRLAPPELVYVLNDCRARVLFAGAEMHETISKIRDQLPHLETIVRVDGEGDEYERWLGLQEVSTPMESGAADRTLLVLYTSGTTGFPKGAMLTHHSVGAHSAALSEALDLDRDSVMVSPLPQFHVGGSTCTWLAAAQQGARTIVVRDLVPAQVLDLLEREQATHTIVVPAVLGGLITVPDAAQRDLSRLRSLGYGSSPIPLPQLKRILQTFRSAGLCQVYGMTEMSGAVTALGPDDHRSPTRDERLTSAGRPLRGVDCAIVDPLTGRTMGPCQTGEVWVRSAQRMAGYWGKPELTAEAFSPDGWLRSGDAGFIDEDGYLYIRDRVKDMVITGGENVYPAEVERVAAAHPAVAEVAVIGVPDERWGESVKAVLVPKAGLTIDAAECIAFCRQYLAGYKCPQSVDVVAALPRNATGKILKRELRAPYWAGHERRV